MSQQDRSKWNKRYLEDSYRKGNPVTLLKNWITEIPAGKTLDLACGAGRNAIYLAQAGFEVDAIDISHEGLKKARQAAINQSININWIEHDLDQDYDFALDYQLIVVLWYVNLPLISRLCDCLAAGGYILCEEHLVTEQEVAGPGNASFRVMPGQLREAVSSLGIISYQESIETGDDGKKNCQRSSGGQKLKPAFNY